MSSDGTEVLKNPWACSREEGDIFQHSELVLIVLFLEVFCPDCIRVASFAEACAATEFAYDEGFVIVIYPSDFFDVSRFIVSVPSDVLVLSEEVNSFRERVIGS